MRAFLCACTVLAACDPYWSAHVDIRDPANRPVEDATLAVGCSEGTYYSNSNYMLVRSTADGHAVVGHVGEVFPVGCDIFVAKPGYRTHRIRYADICHYGPSDCDRAVRFEVVLEPE